MRRGLLLTAAVMLACRSTSPAWKLDVSPQIIPSWSPRPVYIRVAPLKPDLGDCPEIRVEWGDGDAETRAWDCAEGAPAEAFSAWHVYPGPGEYTVTVRVTVAGQSEELWRGVEVI